MVCEPFILPNGARGCVCGPRRASSCSHPGCLQPHTKLCDWPIGGGKTCSKRLCDGHAVSAGPDLDYCPDHEAGYDRDMATEHHLPPCPWEREAKIAAIRGYQAARRDGRPESECVERAAAAFRHVHPEMTVKNCVDAAVHIIAWAAREHKAWFWKGCERPYEDQRRQPRYDPEKGYEVPGDPPQPD